MMKKNVGVILLMAGSSRRFGRADKLFEKIGGKPVWRHSYDVFRKLPFVKRIVLVYSGSDRLWKRVPKIVKITKGGKERQDSVFYGLLALQDEFVDYAFVHDGARPFINEKLVKRVFDAALKYKACVPVVPISPTIKQVDWQKKAVVKTLDRFLLAEAQTPQCFLYKDLLEAYKKAVKSGNIFTDDSAVWQAFKGNVHLTDGLSWNIKITRPVDLTLLKAICYRRWQL